MRTVARTRWLGVLLGAALLLPVGLPAGAPALAAPHRPDPLADAAARATTLRLQVDALRIQAAQAIEAYDGASAAHSGSVTRHLSAQRALDLARAGAGAADRAAERRVRGLYMAGGAPALYAAALQGRDLTDLATRLQAVRSIVGVDRAQRRRADQTLTTRTTAEAALATAAARQTVLHGAMALRAEKVRALLGHSDALLAAADAQVVLLAEEQRQGAAGEAAAAAQAQLARIQLGQGTGQAVGAAGIAVARAAQHLGKPYLWGGNGPDRFDCSGLTVDAYRAAGIALPRTAAQQWFAGPPVALADLAPGDLLYWASDLADAQTIHHVAIFLGGARMLAAPHTGAFVRIQPVYFQGYLGATRPSVRGGAVDSG